MKFTLYFLCIASIVLINAGCNRDSQNPHRGKDSIDQIVDQLGQVLNRPETTLDEVKKLHQIEYDIFKIPATDSTNRISMLLNQRGSERWDCYHVERERTEDNIVNYVFFCKRPVSTPLRYIPGSIVGR